MLEIVNRTPFRAAIAPSIDKSGVDCANVAIKGTFNIVRDRLQVSKDQVKICEGDQYWGHPAKSSIRYASDLGPAKTGTDVALLGYAYPVGGRGKVCDVGLQVGPARKVLRVFGERRWFRSMMTWAPSNPVEFDRMPLVWERAYGGRDDSRPDASKQAWDVRNPVGQGFVASKSKERLEGLALPNLEDVRHPITTWDTRPPPACFGFVAPHWLPRSAWVGTYDEAWQRERCPHLPVDFDERHHNAATAELIIRPFLEGGERVSVEGASPEGQLAFALPEVKLLTTAWIRGRPAKQRPALDTVVIEPDERRVTLTWRASFACPRQFLQTEAVVVAFERKS